MSHHYSGPDFGFPYGDARLDFTELYASASETPPEPATAEPFAPEAPSELAQECSDGGSRQA
jgi:hypothetical protein